MKKSRSRKGGRATGGSTGTKKSYKAPTLGYKDCLFTCSSSKSPTDFLETQKQLARYLSTQMHDGASMASIAYETMTTPEIKEPSKPNQPTNKSDKTEATIFESELSMWTSKYKGQWDFHVPHYTYIARIKPIILNNCTYHQISIKVNFTIGLI